MRLGSLSNGGRRYDRDRGTGGRRAGTRRRLLQGLHMHCLAGQGGGRQQSGADRQYADGQTYARANYEIAKLQASPARANQRLKLLFQTPHRGKYATQSGLRKARL